MRIILAAVAAALALAGCATPARQQGFAHLRFSGRAVETGAPLAFIVSAPAGFRGAGPEHRHADFGGHPYEVSLAALLGSNEAVMVHSERVADASGSSNYDDLPRPGWPMAAFGLRSFCVAVSEEMVASEHDLAWLRAQGWNPVGNVAMDQYLATTPDHNREIVVSLLVRGVDCADEAAVRRALDGLRSRVIVRRR